MSEKPNQMVIGLTSKLPQKRDLTIAFLREGRGFLIYSPIPGGIRMSVHSSDGLDTYYFDLESENVKGMHFEAQQIPDRSTK